MAQVCQASAAVNFIDSMNKTNVTEGNLLQAVNQTFSNQTYADQELVQGPTLNMMGSAVSISNMTFMQGIYQLGPNYTMANISPFVDGIIANGIIATYPVQLPKADLSSTISSNNGTMLMMVSFTVPSSYTTSSGDYPLYDDVNVIRGIDSEVRSETGTPISVYVTGDAAIAADQQSGSSNDMHCLLKFDHHLYDHRSDGRSVQVGPWTVPSS